MSGVGPASRFRGVDVVRGLAIVLMSLDHIRDYWAATEFAAEDLTHTTIGWFMTRWVTHFCAPAFILLAGTSAYLQLARYGDRSTLSRYLLVRGFWLVVLEIVVVNVSWKAGLPVDYLWLQVIWVIGLSMVVCAGAIWLPYWLVAVVAVAMVAGHDLLTGFSPAPEWRWLWQVLHQRGRFEVLGGSYAIFIAYPLLPWPGVMLLGYLLGRLFVQAPQQAVRWCALMGVALLCAFTLLRAWGRYGDPSSFVLQPTWSLSLLSFLNVSKYPASLQFLCVTLGLCLILLALAQRYEFPAAGLLATFGKVPLFFYLLHIPLINLSAQIWTAVSYGEPVNMLTAGPEDWPEGYQPALWRVYVVWAVLLTTMYFACHAYWRYKVARPGRWWLRLV